MFNLWPLGPFPLETTGPTQGQRHTHTHTPTSHPKLSPLSVLAGEVTLIRANCSKLVDPHDGLDRERCVVDVCM